MPSFQYKNSSMNYLDKGEGFPLLFGHSFLCSSSIWQPQIEALSSRYRCIAIDLPAHGDSEDHIPDGICDLKSLAVMYSDFMDHLNLKEYAIIGNSIGGMWGLHLAHMQPESVKAIVTIGSYLGAEPEENIDKYRAMLNVLSKALKIPSLLAEQLSQIFFAPYSFQYNKNLTEKYKQSLEEITPEKILNIVEMAKIIIERPNDLRVLKEIQSPCLIAVGESDIARPPLESKRMIELLPIADYIEIPNAGHLAAAENPSYMNEILLSYLDKVLVSYKKAA